MGLTYGIFSSFPDSSLGSGPWVVSVTTNPQNVDKTINATLEVINNYRKQGITETELQDAKSSLIGGYLVGLATNPEIASRLVGLEYYQLGLDYFQRRSSLVQQVTQAQVNQAIQNYFKTDKLTISMAGAVQP